MRSLLDALVDRGILHHNSQSQYQLATSSVNVTQSEQEVLDAINKKPLSLFEKLPQKQGKLHRLFGHYFVALLKQVLWLQLLHHQAATERT